jgi:hypothetical protein
MRYAITGHTDGIGKALAKSVENSIGFSRSNGYDLTNPSDRKRIINESSESDVFINNACDKFGQSELLLEYWHAYRNEPKTIINVGSVIAELWVTPDRPDLLSYQMYKKTLRTLVIDLQAQPSELEIRYVSFGYVGTPKILTKYPGLKDYITLDEAVRKILE